MHILRQRPGATVHEDSTQLSGSGAASSRPTPPGRLVWLLVASVAAALLPLLVAPVRALDRGWIPVGDDAIFAIRARDAFGGHNPLLGMHSSFSESVGFKLNNPGPLHFELVALPAQLLGDASGIALGVALVNALALVGTVIFSYRRGGPLLAAVAAAAGAWLCFAMGSELLFEPFPSHTPLLPFLFLLVLVWSMTCMDLVALPWAVGIGSVVVQTHLSYGFMAVLLGAWALATIGYELRRRRRLDPDSWPPLRRRAVLAGAMATAVLALAWAQPVIEQLTGSGEGNLRRVTRAIREPVETLGFGRGSRLVAGVVTSPPWRLRSAVFAEPPSTAHAAVLLVLLGAGLALLTWAAVRRRDRVCVAVLGTAAVVLVGALLTAGRVPPVAPLRTSFGVAPHHIMWMWVIHAYLALALAVTAFRLLDHRAVRTGVLVGAMTVTTVVIAAANLPTADQGAVGPPEAFPVSRALGDGLADLDREEPVLVRAPGGFDPYGPAVIAELQERGIPFVVDDSVLVRQLGQDRAFTGDNAEMVLTVRIGEGAESTPPGARRLLLLGPDSDEARELADLKEEIGGFLRGGLPVNEGGREVLAAGFPPGLDEQDPEEGVDPEPLFESRDLLIFVRAGLLTLDDAWEARFLRYADLQERGDEVTVGLFLAPLEDGGNG